MEKEGEGGEASCSSVQSVESGVRIGVQSGESGVRVGVQSGESGVGVQSGEERSKSDKRKDEKEEMDKGKKKRKRKSLTDDKEEQERKRKKIEEEAKCSEPRGQAFRYIKYSSKAIESMIEGLPQKEKRRRSFVVQPFEEVRYDEKEQEELLRETKEFLFKTNEGCNKMQKYLCKHFKRKLKITHSNKNAIYRAFLDQMLRDPMSFSSTNFKNQICHCIVYNYDLFETNIEDQHNMTVGQYVTNILQDKMFKSFVPISEAVAHLLGTGVAVVHLGNMTEDRVTLCGCEQIHDAKLVIATNEDLSHFMATGNNNKFNLLVS